MTISLNWLKQYLDTDRSPDEISDLLTSLGLEVEGMEETETIKGGLAGVVVGHILEAWKHPNADKLTLTKVNIGQPEPLQIVCGAANVTVGQKVLVATAGTTLHPIAGEPITLKKGNIRGETSEGMICAEDELGIGHDHSGILVLPAETPIGLSAREYFHLEKDVIYEIGLTPNRSDATCHLGVARDLAAALAVRFGEMARAKWPAVDLTYFVPTEVGMSNLGPVQVSVENTEACPRYAGISIKNVTVTESPDWLKKRLQSIGQRPINNIVDITNFVLHELGQPLHAFDLDKISGQKIVVKTLPEGSKFLSLDGQERTLGAEDLMICDGGSNGMCIGGVFGGLHSGVTADTKNIFLESAHFNARWIRRTSTRHGLRTDAARVFEKGSDPNICVFALKRAALLMCEIAGGEIASEVVDIYPQPIKKQRITVSYDYVNRLIGLAISPEKIRDILMALDMPIAEQTESGFTVGVPTNKADVTRPADVVEEILRVYGLDNVPVPTQIRSSMVRNEYPDPNQVRNTIGDWLAANGFQEIMALSLSQSAYYKDILPKEDSELVYVNNTSNVQLDIMRPNMLFSGLEAVAHNQNRQQTDLKLFEFGKTYETASLPPAPSEGGWAMTAIVSTSPPSEGPGGRPYYEPQHLALFLTGQREGESWRNPAKQEADYFTLKALAGGVLARLGIGGGYQETAVQNEVLTYGLEWRRGPQVLVVFGKVQPGVCKKMGIRNAVFYADFNWDLLLQAAKKQSVTFAELNRFPTVRRDLAVVIGKSVKFSDLSALAKKIGKKLLKDIRLFDVFEDESKLGEGKKSYAIGMIFEAAERTLQDQEVDGVVQELIIAFETKLGAVVRR